MHEPKPALLNQHHSVDKKPRWQEVPRPLVGAETVGMGRFPERPLGRKMALKTRGFSSTCRPTTGELTGTSQDPAALGREMGELKMEEYFSRLLGSWLEGSFMP